MATLSTNTAPYERPFLMIRRVWPGVGQIDVEELQRQGLRWPKDKKRKPRSEDLPQTFALPFPTAEPMRPVAETTTRKFGALLMLANPAIQDPERLAKARETLAATEADSGATEAG
jgi:hypothetical protein